MKSKIYLTVLLLIFPLGFSSCSIVFTSSISGKIHDMEKFDGGQPSGIDEGEVFLYLDDAKREKDYQAWKNSGLLPGNSASPSYFQSTTSNGEGVYSFNGIIWEELNPQFGKTASRVKVYMLVYHRNYGVVKNNQPFYIVSDQTNNLPPLKMKSAINKITIRGSVYDKNRKNNKGGKLPLRGVQVKVYIPVEWSYEGDEILNKENLKYPKEANFTFSTDENGGFKGEIAFPMKPNLENNKKSCPIRVSYELENYVAYELTDAANNDFKSGDSATPLNPENWVSFKTNGVFDIDMTTSLFDIDQDGRKDISILKIVDLNKPNENVLPTINLRRYSFNSAITGHTYKNSGDRESGMEVHFYWGASANHSDPNIAYKTSSKSVWHQQTEEKGAFTISGIRWNQYNYTEENAFEIYTLTTNNGTVDIKLENQSLSNGENSCEIK